MLRKILVEDYDLHLAFERASLNGLMLKKGQNVQCVCVCVDGGGGGYYRNYACKLMVEG